MDGVQKGWLADARETLLGGLRTRPQHLPSAWIEAVASFKDPGTYGDLKAYLASGRDTQSTYAAIKDLPGIDLTEAVAAAWRKAKYEGWGAVRVAPLAMEFGHADALEVAVHALVGGPDPWQTYQVQQTRKAVLRYTEARGDDQEIRHWFEENKDNLVFDLDTKKFRVQKGK